MKITIVKLSGGLGNQLFQYAFARAFSIKNQTKLYLDLSSFRSLLPGETKRKYELDFYNHKGSQYPLSFPYFSKIYSKFPFILKLFGVEYYKEKTLSYDPTIMGLKGDFYFDGYWQSFKYFQEYSILLSNELLPFNQSSMNESCLKLLSSIHKSISVAIHVRRGDYITNKSAKDTHGLLEEIYYKNAIQYMNERVSNPFYFVFSDDLEWCRAFFSNIKGNFIYPSKNSNNLPQEDIFLISNCNHSIIANSSFSWWGAWLGDCMFDSVNRIVIAPKQWFIDDAINDIDSRLPKHWIKI